MINPNLVQLLAGGGGNQVQSQLMGLGGFRPAPIGQPPLQFHPGPVGPVQAGQIPPPPPAPGRNGVSPLRQVFQDLQQGLNPVQMRNIMAGHVPGHEHGDFQQLQHHGQIIQMIAQMLAHGGQLPGNFNRFAHQINQGLGNHLGPIPVDGGVNGPVEVGPGGNRIPLPPRPPVKLPMMNPRKTMLEHFLQRAIR